MSINETTRYYTRLSGKMVSHKGREIYQALIAGENVDAIRDKFDLSGGSMHGYIDRAVKYGLITDNRKKRNARTIVAVSMMKNSEGDTYEMRGGAEVFALGFEYGQAWSWAKKKIEKHGYLWYFKGEL